MDASRVLGLGLIAGLFFLTNAAKADEIGAATAVQPATARAAEGAASAPLQAGDPIAQMDTIETDASGQAALLFLDESTLTIGPNSEILIDEFVYDGESRAFSMNISQGLARYAGGRISKEKNVVFTTPQGTIGVRGGMLVMEVGKDSTLAAHQFGILTCEWKGEQEVITKEGFACVITPDGIEVIPIPPDLLERIFALLTGGGDSGEGDDVTTLLDIFCDSEFATNHKDCDAPPGGLAGTQPEDLDDPQDAKDEGELTGNTQEPEDYYNNDCAECEFQE